MGLYHAYEGAHGLGQSLPHKKDAVEMVWHDLVFQQGDLRVAAWQIQPTLLHYAPGIGKLYAGVGFVSDQPTEQRQAAFCAEGHHVDAAFPVVPGLATTEHTCGH